MESGLGEVAEGHKRFRVSAEASASCYHIFTLTTSQTQGL